MCGRFHVMGLRIAPTVSAYTGIYTTIPVSNRDRRTSLIYQFADWDSERTYDEDPPSYIHYSIEWKVTVNDRAIMPKDTVTRR